MINALGNLLPNRSSDPGPNGQAGGAAASGIPESDDGSGTFTHALLQFLNPEAPDPAQATGKKGMAGSAPTGIPASEGAVEGEAFSQLLNTEGAPEADPDGEMIGTGAGTGSLGHTSTGDPSPNVAPMVGDTPQVRSGGQGSGAGIEGDPFRDGIRMAPEATSPSGPQAETSLAISNRGARNGIETRQPETGLEAKEPRSMGRPLTGDAPRPELRIMGPNETGKPVAPARDNVPAVPPASPVPQATKGAGPSAQPLAPTSGPVSAEPPEVVGSIETAGSVSPTTAASGPDGPTAVAEAKAADSFPIDRDPSRLDPDFRVRLDRVIERMETEFGHKVVMVEGYRSPDRQQALYAQGRTQPGPVATWTQNSMHSQGRAADLQVDGSWDSPVGYARLQFVAAEEGLRVLGGKDPGHVELPEDGWTNRSQADGLRLRPAVGETLGSGVARTASVARPAAAQVASAARVARPATVGGGRRAQPISATTPDSGPGQVNVSGPEISQAPGTPVPTTGSARSQVAEAPIQPSTQNADPAASTRAQAEPAKPTPDVSRPPIPSWVSSAKVQSQQGPTPQGVGQPETLPGDVRAQSASTDTRPGETPGPTAPNPAPAGLEPVQAGESQGRAAPQATAPAQLSGIDRVGPAQRINEIQAMGETWDTQALGRIHLDMDNVDGAGTRLRLALRGSELAGALDLSDPVLAARMRDRIGELHQALSRQGLDAQGLEARAIAGIDGRGAADGDLASLLKDPLAGMARILDAKDASGQARGDDSRNTRQESFRGEERLRDNQKRDQNKENRQ